MRVAQGRVDRASRVHGCERGVVAEAFVFLSGHRFHDHTQREVADIAVGERRAWVGRQWGRQYPDERALHVMRGGPAGDSFARHAGAVRQQLFDGDRLETMIDRLPIFLER